jgi:hypothetical protein
MSRKCQYQSIIKKKNFKGIDRDIDLLYIVDLILKL